MTGTWATLRAEGRLDDGGIALVYETVDAVRRFDRFPPPAGALAWTVTAVQEFAHDFLYADGGPERLARIAATATDEDSFERVLEAAIRNEFRMRARSTDTGAVLRSLTHAVDNDPDIVVAGATPTTRTWSLPAHQHNLPYAGPTDVLVEAAHAAPDVRRARWSAESTRRAPIAAPDSLRRVLHAVLDRAGAPLQPRRMVEVILARFPLATTEDVDLTDELIPEVASSADSSLLARQVWEQLTDNERLVLGVLDLPVREMAEATGLSRSTAQRAATGAKEVLAGFLAGLPDQPGVVAALAAESAAARDRGTARAGSASTGEEED
ncbi:MAG: hypothetical protein ACOYXM_17845 [Actinomycetota bacterium]